MLNRRVERSSEEHVVALHTQRMISQVMHNNKALPSITIEVPADGECGFTAVEYALRIAGKDTIACAVSRRGVMDSVKQKMRQILEPNAAVLDDQSREQLKNLLRLIFLSSGIHDIEFSEETLARWEYRFREWANDAHFSWLSFLHNIRFEFFIIDHQDNASFIPRIGVLGGDSNSIDLGEAAPEEKITISLAHVSTQVVNINLLEPNNHFDLLLVDPTEEMRQAARNKHYIITQEKFKISDAVQVKNKVDAPEVLYAADSVSEILKNMSLLCQKSKDNLQKIIADIKENYEVINDFLLSDCFEDFLGQIKLACEATDRLCYQVYSLTNIEEYVGLSYRLYYVLRDPIKNLQNYLEKVISIGSDQIRDNSLRTKKLYAEQGIIASNLQYQRALEQHLRVLRKFSTPTSVITENPCGQRCFISYAWPLRQHFGDEQYLQSFLQIFREHLRLAGVQAILDFMDNHPGNSTHAYMDHVRNSEFIILVLTESLRDKHHDPFVRAVQSELSLIDTKFSIDLKTLGENTCRIFPWMLSGDLGFSNPPRYQMYSNVRDARDYHYLTNLKNIIGWIYFDAIFYISSDNRKSQLRDEYNKLWEDFFREYREILEVKIDADKEHHFFFHENNITKIRGEKSYMALVIEKGSEFFNAKKMSDSQSTVIVPRAAIPLSENDQYGRVNMGQQSSKSIKSQSAITWLSVRGENFSMPLGNLTSNIKKCYFFPDPVHSLIEISFQEITGRVSRNKLTRLGFLNQIEHAFQNDSGVVLTDPKHYQRILVGNGGMGKTEMTKIYARYCRIKKPPRYRLIWWIDATDSLEHQFAILLKELFNLHAFGVSNKIDVAKWAYKNLEQVDHWLLIFDNVEEASYLIGYQPFDHLDVLDLSDSEKRRHYIVTTRHPEWPSQNIIELTGLTREEVCEFSQQYNLNYEKNELLLLERGLHGHPLGIAHAFNYLATCKRKGRELSIEEYIQRLSQLPALSIVSHHPTPSEYGYENYLVNALKAVHLSILLLKENFHIDSVPEEISQIIIQKILCCFGYLKRTNVPHDLISVILMTFNQSESLTPVIIRLLQEYYIIESSDDKSFTLHQIVQRCLQSTLLQDDHQETFSILLQAINQKFDYYPKTQQKLNDVNYEKWIKQAESLLLVSHYDNLGSDTLRLEMYSKLGVYFSFETRQYDKSFLWLAKAEKQLFSLDQNKSRVKEWAEIYNAFAWSYLAQEQFESSEQCILNLFKLYDYNGKSLCPNLECAQGLVTLFAIKGNMGDALDQSLSENCLLFCEQFRGDRTCFAFIRVYAEAQLNQGVLLNRIAGNYNLAYEFIERCVGLYQAAFSLNHPRALEIRQQLIQILLTLSNIHKAKNLIMDAISFIDLGVKSFNRITLRYYFIESCSKYCALDEINEVKNEILEISCENDFFVHEYDRQGRNIFHLAASGNHVELVQLLLRSEIYSIHTASLFNGFSALHWAAIYGHLDMLTFLMSEGVNVNIQNKYGNTALHLAIEGNHEEIVDLFLSSEVDLTIRNSFGDSPLHTAVLNNRFSMLKKILQKNSNIVNLLGFNNSHALLMVNANEALADILFDFGANFKDFSVAPYMYLRPFLALKKYDVVMKWLDRFPDLLIDCGGNPLLLSVYLNDKEWADFLYQKNNQLLNQVDKNGYSAVMVASLIGSLELLQWLVAQGADTTMLNKMGDNAVNLAVIGYSLSVLQWLLSQGLREVKNNFGLTASKIALLYKSSEMQYMLDAFSSENSVGNNLLLEIEAFGDEYSIFPYIHRYLTNNMLPLFSLLTILNACYYFPLEWRVDINKLSDFINKLPAVHENSSLRAWHLILQSKIMMAEELSDVIFRAFDDSSIEVRLTAFALWENLEAVLGVSERWIEYFNILLSDTDFRVTLYVHFVLRQYEEKYADIRRLLIKNANQYEHVIRFYGGKFGFHIISTLSFVLVLINLKLFEISSKHGFLFFDKNLTVIVRVHAAFSLHLTYEPNSDRLYLYSPLLDGLPIDARLALYELLLEGSMLGGKMLGGGVGVAVDQGLILMHRYIDMKSATIDTLKNIVPYFIHYVECWRFQIQAIIENNFFVSGVFSGPKQLALSIRQIKSSLECAKENLSYFAKDLNLVLVFDENYTCILGIDNKFSVHFTYEPESELLYLYAPLLDGLPVEHSRRLALYEKLLTGSMLGGQMAGGGVGVATKEGLILMHCNINMRNASKDALKRFAPFFVETVEKWRDNCLVAMRESALNFFQHEGHNKLLDISYIERAYSFYDNYVGEKRKGKLEKAIEFLEQAIVVIINADVKDNINMEILISWQLELVDECIQKADIQKARIAWSVANDSLIHLPSKSALHQVVQEYLKRFPSTKIEVEVMFSFDKTPLIFKRKEIDALLQKITFPENQIEFVDSCVDEIAEKYAIIVSSLSNSYELSRDIITACEKIENLAAQVRGIVSFIDLVKANQLYQLLAQQANELKSQIQDRLSIDPFVLQTSLARTKKLLATQSVVSRESAQYAAALREHLLSIRQLFYPASSREAPAEGPTCFISYAWPLHKYKESEEHLQAFLRILHKHLDWAGVRIVLDILDNPADNSMHIFMQQAKSSDYVILILTQSLRDKHNDPLSRAVHSELSLIREKHDADIRVGHAVSRIFPVIVSGELGLSNPPYLQMYSNVKDWREHHYLEDLKSFLYWVYIATSSRKANDTIDERYEALWREFTESNPMPVFMTDEEVKKELEVSYHPELMKVIKSTQAYGDLAKKREKDFFVLDFQHDSMFTIPNAADARFIAEARQQLDPVNGQEQVTSELELYISPFGRDPMAASSATPAKLLLEFVRDFFNSSAKVLLLQGRAGSGKTVFGLHLAHTLNTRQREELQLPVDAIVIFISLPGLNDPVHDIFYEYFSQKYGVDAENEIKQLKSRKNVYFIFDAYDEIDEFQKDISQVKNLYTTNKMSEWSNAKFIFTCRYDFLQKMTEKFSDASYRKFFTPVIFGKSQSDLFTEVQAAEFSPEQVGAYIDEYVRLGRHRLPPYQNNMWDAQTYKQKIQELPNIGEIVKNPLYLKMTIEALPFISDWHEARIRDSAERFSKITERDVFFAYLKFNILRQEDKILQTVAISVPIGNFRSRCITFLTRLCRKMVENQVYKVPYRFSRTERDMNRMNQGAEWATEFFGDPYLKQDKEQLEILESLRHNLMCFLTYEKGVWGFMHDVFRDRFDDLNLAELLHFKTELAQGRGEEDAAAEAVDKFVSVLFDEALGPYYITQQNEWAGVIMDYDPPRITETAAALFADFGHTASSFIADSGDDNVPCDTAYENRVERAVREGWHLLQGEGGNTALHLAIKNVQLEKIIFLLKEIKKLGTAGAAILNIQNNESKTISMCYEDLSMDMPDIGELLESIKRFAPQNRHG